VATSGKGGIGPFIGICLMSGAFGVADAHAQGGMVGDLSLMCPEFIQVGICGFYFSLAVTYYSHVSDLFCSCVYPVLLSWYGCIWSSDLCFKVNNKGNF